MHWKRSAAALALMQTRSRTDASPGSTRRNLAATAPSFSALTPPFTAVSSHSRALTPTGRVWNESEDRLVLEGDEDEDDEAASQQMRRREKKSDAHKESNTSDAAAACSQQRQRRQRRDQPPTIKEKSNPLQQQSQQSHPLTNPLGLPSDLIPDGIESGDFSATHLLPTLAPAAPAASLAVGGRRSSQKTTLSSSAPPPTAQPNGRSPTHIPVPPPPASLHSHPPTHGRAGSSIGATLQPLLSEGHLYVKEGLSLESRRRSGPIGNLLPGLALALTPQIWATASAAAQPAAASTDPLTPNSGGGWLSGGGPNSASGIHSGRLGSGSVGSGSGHSHGHGSGVMRDPSAPSSASVTPQLRARRLTARTPLGYTQLAPLAGTHEGANQHGDGHSDAANATSSSAAAAAAASSTAASSALPPSGLSSHSNSNSFAPLAASVSANSRGSTPTSSSSASGGGGGSGSSSIGSGVPPPHSSMSALLVRSNCRCPAETLLPLGAIASQLQRRQGGLELRSTSHFVLAASSATLTLSFFLSFTLSSSTLGVLLLCR